MQTVSSDVQAANGQTANGQTANGSGRRLLSLDDGMFAASFDRHPFKITHNLVGHPLLQLPRLVELARVLKSPILYFRGDHAINQFDGGPTDSERSLVGLKLARPELSPVETIAQIESARAWLQLRDVGQDPEYAALLGSIITEFRIPSERVAPGLYAPRADIFISSPGSTTPFHLDEEHNFLLQMRGSKKLSIADGFNPEVLGGARVQSLLRTNGELAPYSEHLEQHSVHVDLVPGEGVHIPPCHPHWIQNGPEVSISLGILWLSDVTARRRALFRMNDWLGRVGLKPSPPGDRPVSDSIKMLPHTFKRRVRRWWRR